MKSLLFSLIVSLFVGAGPAVPPLRHDFYTASPLDERTAWNLLNYRLPESFSLTSRQLIRHSPISRHSSLTVVRYLENPEDGALLQLGTYQTIKPGHTFQVPVSFYATHWFVISDGPTTVVKYLVFYDHESPCLRTAYIEETQQQLYPIATNQ